MEKREPLIGDNRTGVARAAKLVDEMLRGNDEFAPEEVPGAAEIAEVRAQYAREGDGIGTLPPPASVKQLGKAAKAMLAEGSAAVFTDKLGARLAFERMGVRLYQALLSKLETFEPRGGAPTRAELEHIMHEELEHFGIVRRAIEAMGGDPTAVTPSAEIESIASQGVHAIVVDPRTNLVQSLEAILLAELADNEQWDGLVLMARKLGEDGLAAQFERAQLTERQHLAKVRSWHASLLGLADEERVLDA